MAGEIFYPPPQPQQRLPKVPIPAQGQQPPRYAGILADAMSCILASWPTGLEHPPVQKRLNVAPLTLTYGQQPPRWSAAQYMQPIVLGWPTGFEHMPTQKPLKIAPLTLRYGSQPPPLNDALEMEQILLTWPTGFEYQPYQLPRRPPIPTPGDAPPQSGPMAGMPSMLVSVINWIPPDPWPRQLPLTVAPLTLTYGDRPPKYSVAPMANLIEAWRPPPPQPMQRPITAPIPRQGDQPAPFTFHARMQNVLASWPTGFEYQAPQLTESAATLPAPVVVAFVPFTGLQAHILRAWETAPFPVTQSPPDAAVSLPRGDQPPPYTGILLDMMVVRQAWEPPPPMPVQLPETVALTLTYGDQPPRSNIAAVNLAVEVRAWEPPPPLPVLRPLTVALTLVYGSQPPPPISQLRTILTAWEPLPQPVQRGPSATVQFVAPMPPPRPYPIQTILGYYGPPDVRQRQVALAPLTLRYGDQPRYSTAMLNALVASWVPPPPDQVFHQLAPWLVSAIPVTGFFIDEVEFAAYSVDAVRFVAATCDSIEFVAVHFDQDRFVVGG